MTGRAAVTVWGLAPWRKGGGEGGRREGEEGGGGGRKGEEGRGGRRGRRGGEEGEGGEGRRGECKGEGLERMGGDQRKAKGVKGMICLYKYNAFLHGSALETSIWCVSKK